MNRDYEPEEHQECDIYERIHRLIKQNTWAWQSIGAVSGLVGGILSPVLGTLLMAVAWFMHSEEVVSSLNGLSIVSFFLTIPLLTFGAHCLDLLERKSARLSLIDRGDKGWAIAVGNNLFVPVRNKSYDLGTYSYTMVQKTFKTKTRIGAGGYFFSKNVVAANANRAGGLFAIEQAVTSKFGLQADWFTGDHANGYFTPGGHFRFTRKITGFAAYSIGNARVTNGNHFLYFEVGYNFN